MPERISTEALAANDAVENEEVSHGVPRPGAGHSLQAAGHAAIERMIVATHDTGLKHRAAPTVGERTKQGGSFARPPLSSEHKSPAPGGTQLVAGQLQALAPASTQDNTRVQITPPLLMALHPAANPADGHAQASIGGTAFVRGPGDLNDIDPNDVRQGGLGDCYLLSSLAAVARANPGLIRRLVRKVDAHSYEVTLYAKDHFWEERTPHTIRVSDQFPVEANGRAAYAKPSDAGREGPELWVMLFEKAYATLEGSYADIVGGSGEEGMSLLLAGGATTHATSDYSATALGKLLYEHLRAHRPVTTGTTHGNVPLWSDELKQSYPWLPDWFKDRSLSRGRQAGAVAFHEYSIAQVDLKSRKIHIQNPWGFSHLVLSFEDYQTIFTTFAVGTP